MRKLSAMAPAIASRSSSSSARHRRGLRRVALLPVLGVLMLALSAPAPALAMHEPTFTCRASALRVETFAPLPALTIEPFHTADTGTGPGGRCPAGAQKVGLVGDDLPGNLGTADVLFAETKTNGGAQSRAGVLDLTLNAPAPIGPISAEVLTSEASAACTAGAPKFTGSSTIVALNIAGQDIEPVPGTPQTITVPGGILTIELAKQVIANNTITQQALVVTAYDLAGNKLAQVVVAEAIADVHGCKPPCPQGQVRSHETGECMKQCPGGKLVKPDEDCPKPPPPPPPPGGKCNAGKGNGSEPAPPTDCDPGNSGGNNKGGD